ncbi:MAG TPA: hypothetical protein VFW65_15530 [Pseudonocardiaceae bacterium]|nr:hypothetical protein [Pseudonocardiaceae bacterium]
MADYVADYDEFGADGTQPLPPPQLLPDPLGGLVTGSLFSDTIVPLTVAETPAAAAQAAAPATQARRRTVQATGSRRTVGPQPGATTPTAIPVAESLPGGGRRENRRQTVVRATTPIAVTPPLRNTPARNTTARNVSSGTRSARTPASARPAPAIRTSRRSAGAGCAMFLVIVIVLVTIFVVLGVVLGHGNTGLSGG